MRDEVEYGRGRVDWSGERASEEREWDGFWHRLSINKLRTGNSMVGGDLFRLLGELERLLR